jgi:hypothetical protein
VCHGSEGYLEFVLIAVLKVSVSAMHSSSMVGVKNLLLSLS